MASGSVLDHVSMHLGSKPSVVEYGPGAADIPVSVARFTGQPVPGAVLLMTVGMSDWLLEDPSRAVPARQELYFCHYLRGEPESPSPSIMLAMLARVAVSAGKTWPVGRVIQLGGPLFEGSSFAGLFATSGSYLQPGVSLVESTDPPTDVAWLIPVHPAEIATIRSAGWNAFDELLTAHDPDLLDLARSPI